MEFKKINLTIQQMMGIGQAVTRTGSFSTDELCQLNWFNKKTQPALQAYGDLGNKKATELNAKKMEKVDREAALMADKELKEAFTTTEHEIELSEKTITILKQRLEVAQFPGNDMFMVDVFEKFGCVISGNEE